MKDFLDCIKAAVACTIAFFLGTLVIVVPVSSIILAIVENGLWLFLMLAEIPLWAAIVLFVKWYQENEDM